MSALDASTKAKIAEANKADARSAASAPKDEAAENRKKAIDEINRALLQTKPSYDLAKQALDEWKANLIENLGGATEANQEYIDKIEQIYSVKLKQIYDKSLLDSNKWETVLPKNTKMGGNNIIFNISTPNAQSFMESQGQIMSKLAAQMGRHKARNG